MRFDVYDRFQLEVVREKGRWVAYRLGLGKRSPAKLAIPSWVAPSEMATYLDDLLHELSGPRSNRPAVAGGDTTERTTMQAQGLTRRVEQWSQQVASRDPREHARSLRDMGAYNGRRVSESYVYPIGEGRSLGKERVVPIDSEQSGLRA